jgi:integrase
MVVPQSERHGQRKPERFAMLFNAAGLRDARSHDLRRTFASVAADCGYSDATIAEFLGHARRGVTERYYVRRGDPVMVAAANTVSGAILAAMSGRAEGEATVIPLRGALSA